MWHRGLSWRYCMGLAGGLLLGSHVALTQAQPSAIATLAINPALIVWQPQVTYETLILTVSAPDGEVFRHEFSAGEPVALSPIGENGGPLPDGLYIYELRVIPIIDKQVKKTLAQARERGDDVAVEREFKARGAIPQEPLVQSGGFTIAGGVVMTPTEATEPR
jgi:hypothetical protein